MLIAARRTVIVMDTHVRRRARVRVRARDQVVVGDQMNLNTSAPQARNNVPRGIGLTLSNSKLVTDGRLSDGRPVVELGCTL